MADEALRTLAARLRGADRVTVLTGAGVSSASGVPTFRGAGGLWRQFRAEDLATSRAFAKDPQLVWEWYRWRRERIAGCNPNSAHRVLAAWTTRHAGWRVVTQNVDGLHLAAGTRDLIRLHGSIWELCCWEGCEGRPGRWPDARVPLETLPRCVYCGGLARPAVVWFGESLDPGDVRRASVACSCDVFIAAGTSAIVYPAAGLIGEARDRGAFVVEINTEATPASSRVDLAIAGRAEQILPAVDALL